MFRIRFASGEEAFFQTVKELAEGVRSGAIPATAEIFHARSQRWLPIAVHPAYERALSGGTVEQPVERESPLAREAAAGIPADAIQGVGFQIYQMTSKSALEIAERRRPRPMALVTTLVGGLLMVGSVAWLAMTRTGSEVAQPLAARELATVTTPRPLSTGASRTWPNAPAGLALRLARLGDNAARALDEGTRALGLSELTAPARLGSPAAVQATRDGLVSFRERLTLSRAALQARQDAYADTAAMLFHTGAWSQADAEEWRLRSRPAEPPEDAARADSLLTALERLYELLFSETGRYRIGENGARFMSLARGDEYEEIRQLIQHLTAARPEQERPPSATLATIISLAGGGALPAPVSR